MASTARMSEYLPVKDGMDTFWFRDPHEMSDHRTTANLPEKSDVVIIGAGYAGVATAYHLLKDSPGDFSVTIVEARGVCSGATGRNGGHVRPDLYGHIPSYIARAGTEAGAEVSQFEVDNMWAIKKAVEDERIDCDFTLQRSIDVWCNSEAAQTAKATYDKMAALNLEFMRDVYFTDDPRTAEGYSGVKGAKAAASFTAGTMWPYKFVLGLLQVVVSTGRVNVQTNTPVTCVTADTQHGWAVTTERGTIYASKVIHATNGYVASLLPQYDRNIIPCKGICCHIDIPKESDGQAPLLNNSYINRTDDKTLSYLIPRTDGSIVVGGAAAKFRPFRDQWYSNVDDSVLIDSAKDYYDGYMQETYRDWENTSASVRKIWTGVMGYSFDSNPHIGAVPGLPGQFIAAGFNGHGMPVIWLAAKGLAKMIAAERNGSELAFAETGVPRLFQTTQARIVRARSNKEEDGDILGTGEIFLPQVNGEVMKKP